MARYVKNGTGHIVHGITSTHFKGKVSAWFDAERSATEMEQILPSGVCRPVKRNGPLWDEASYRAAPYLPRS